MNKLKMLEDNIISGCPRKEDVCTTPTGKFKMVINDCLKSGTNIYKIRAFIGSGAFGQVVKCTNRLSKREVAVKIISSHSACLESTRTELKMLRMIMKIDQGKYFVQAYDFFEYQNHTCIAFEMLEQSLTQLYEKHTIPTQAICYILKQLLSALLKLKEIDVVHTDLKPDNIMLVNSVKFPYRVKIIDFGGASKANEIASESYITTRPYRSPEVLLGLPCNEKIDMWSLGCSVAELLTKRVLYLGRSELEQLRCICTTQGLLPTSMLNEGPKTKLFFDCDPWKLKSCQDPYGRTSTPAVNCLDELITLNSSDVLKDEKLQEDIVLRTKIVDLIKKMLELDPKKRISCLKALMHQVVSQPTRWDQTKILSKL